MDSPESSVPQIESDNTLAIWCEKPTHWKRTWCWERLRARGEVTSWQIDGETMGRLTYVIFLSSKITVDCDYSHEIKRHLFLGRNAMINLDSIKKQRHHFADKGPYSQSYGFSHSHVQMWDWTIKKSEHWRIDTFQLWCWRRLLRVLWSARRSNQSILKEISPEYSLERLMLKLKLQYFAHLI